MAKRKSVHAPEWARPSFEVEGPLPPPGALAAQPPAQPKPKVRKTAIFIAHGMGQQIRFETVDALVCGLRQEAVKMGLRKSVELPLDRVITLDDEGERSHGVALRLEPAGGGEVTSEGGGGAERAPQRRREIHIFEGYWAPLVEGKVFLRDVLRFLFGAAGNGLRNSRQTFERWLFGRYDKNVPLGWRKAMWLAAALFVVLSLVMMNFAVLLKLLALTPLASPKVWDVSGNATRQLARIFHALLAPIVLLALLLAWQKALRDRAVAKEMNRKQEKKSYHPRASRLFRCLDAFALLAAVVTLLAIIACGVATLLLLLYYSFYRGSLLASLEAAKGVHSNAVVNLLVSLAHSLKSLRPSLLQPVGHGFSLFFAGGFSVLAVCVLSALSLRGVLRVIALIRPQVVAAREGPPDGPTESRKAEQVVCRPKTSPAFVAAGALFLYLGAGLFILFCGFRNPNEGICRFATTLEDLALTLAWPLFIGTSLLARRFLIQFLGDVAAYVSPHSLDRFFELREKLRCQLVRQAKLVYQAKERDEEGERFAYDEIYIVGHSLGSVIAYDALNRLLADDEVAKDGGSPAKWLDVLGRTKLLLTFGSPLDKIAFLFGLQGRETSEPREVLLAQTQPLIRHADFRQKIQWINLFSKRDIIGSKLDLFGSGRDEPGVTNIADPFAATWLAAHTEHWTSPLLYRKLLEA